jgi:hypothetical protein
MQEEIDGKEDAAIEPQVFFLSFLVRLRVLRAFVVNLRRIAPAAR